ncbi:MAG: helix-turn-helix transcriptional regulator [Thermomicrobiales bacterium]
MSEKRPIHPGEILAEDVLAELSMSGRQMSVALGVSTNRISGLTNCSKPRLRAA